MTLSDAIVKRCAVRKYSDTPLTGEHVEMLRQFMSDVSPLDASIRTDIGFENEQTPARLLIFSEEKDGWLENAGAVGEMIVLYLTGLGIGTCWLGMARPKQPSPNEMQYVISISLGYPEEGIPFRSNEGEFKRKPLSQSIIGGEPSPAVQKLLEAARLAPTAVNFQPVRYQIDGQSIHIFRKKPTLGLRKMGDMQAVDAGIAMAHIIVTAREAGSIVTYTKQQKNQAGLIYAGTITIE